MAVHFKTQAHVAVIPTADAHLITSQQPYEFTSKGLSFKLPMILQNKMQRQDENRHIRIMCALVGRSRTFVFVDHQAFITIRIGRLNRQVTRSDLQPESQVSRINACEFIINFIFIHPYYSFGRIYGLKTKAQIGLSSDPGLCMTSTDGSPCINSAKRRFTKRYTPPNLPAMVLAAG